METILEVGKYKFLDGHKPMVDCQCLLSFTCWQEISVKKEFLRDRVDVLPIKISEISNKSNLILISLAVLLRNV